MLASAPMMREVMGDAARATAPVPVARSSSRIPSFSPARASACRR